MTMYPTKAQFGGVPTTRSRRLAEDQARSMLAATGRAAPQANNYAGGGPRTEGSTRIGPGNYAGPPLRPVAPVAGQPPIQQAVPQVRDRAFNQSEQEYRAGGAPVPPRRPVIGEGGRIPDADVAPGAGGRLPPTAGVRVGAIPHGVPTAAGQPPFGFGGMAGPAANAPRMQDYLPDSMAYKAVVNQRNNPVAGMSVLGGYVPTQQGGAGSVQTRMDVQTPWGYMRDSYNQWHQNAQDNRAGEHDSNATYTGSVTGGEGDEARAEQAAAQGDAALEAELSRQIGQEFKLSDYDGSAQLPRPDLRGGMTSFAEWLADMVGAPFGAAAKVLNRYGRDAVSDYYDQWSDLDPLRDTGRELMDADNLQRYEDAARNRLRSSVESERDAAMRALEGKAGRGGAIGTGAQTGIHNAAMRSMMEGEQRLIEDAFRRKLASQQLGAGIYGDAIRAKYGTMEDTYVSPGELAGVVIPGMFDLAGTALETTADAFGGGPGPIPFLQLLFGG